MKMALKMLKNTIKFSKWQRIKKFLVSHKELLSLYGISALNAGIPIFIYFYLSKTISADELAMLAMTEAISVIIYSISMQGYDVIGVVLLKREQDGPKVFWSVIYARLGVFLLLVSIMAAIGHLAENGLINNAMFWLPNIIGNLLISQYYFQYKGRLASLLKWMLIGKALVITYLIVRISKTTEFSEICLVIGVTNLLVAIVLLGLNVAKPVSIPVKHLLVLVRRSASHTFSNLGIAILKDINIIILGLFYPASSVIVNYALAEKIIKGFQFAIRPLNRIAMYKYVDARVGNDVLDLASLAVIVRTQFKHLTVILFFSYIFLAALGSYFLKFFEIEIVLYSLILAPSLFFGVYNYFYGPVFLGLRKNGAEYFYLVLCSALIYLPCLVSVLAYSKNYGIYLAYNLSEIILVLLIYIKIGKLRISE